MTVASPARFAPSSAANPVETYLDLKSLELVRHFKRHQEGTSWILTTRKGVRIARFETENAMDEWCSQRLSHKPAPRRSITAKSIVRNYRHQAHAGKSAPIYS